MLSKQQAQSNFQVTNDNSLIIADRIKKLKNIDHGYGKDIENSAMEVDMSATGWGFIFE